MLAYLLRRLLYAIPILIGVNLLTFLLFFTVNTPDDIARARLGQKHIAQEAVTQWKEQHGYAKPLLYNTNATGTAKLTDTIFFNKTVRLLAFQFGASDAGRDIGVDLWERMWPSLAIALPSLLLGLTVNIIFALLFTLLQGSRFDTIGMVICIVLMSISGLFYIIGGQFMIGKLLKWVPISGYEGGWQAAKFIVLPVLIGVISGIGSGVRWYRAIFLEEIHKDYVRTARAKGLSEWQVLFRHVLPNGLIPILTGVVVIIPSLFMGSLILESFFGIPGLGSYTLDAIAQQDFAIVRVMVFLGSFLYIVGLVLTDLSYVLVDPRVYLR